MLTAKARTVIVADSILSPDLTDYLHRRGMFCWVTAKNGEVEAVANAVFCGVDGIVMADTSAAWNYLEQFRDYPTVRMKPTVVAHRGVSHNGKYLENSLKSVAAAVDMGVYFIEADLTMTADGQLIVFHDDTIDRLLLGSGSVSDYTLDELKKIPMRADVSERVMSADEFIEAVIKLYPEIDIVFSLELKDRFSEKSFYAVQELMQKNPQYYERTIINDYVTRDKVRETLGNIGIRGHMDGEVLPTGWDNNAELANILITTRRENIWWTRLTHGVPWYSFDQIHDSLFPQMYARSVPLLVGWQDDPQTIMHDILNGIPIFTGNVPCIESFIWGIDSSDIYINDASDVDVSVQVEAFSYKSLNATPDGFYVLSEENDCKLYYEGGKLHASGSGCVVIQWYIDCFYNNEQYRVYSLPIRVVVQ